MCAVAGIAGTYAGTYLTMERVKREQKEISRLIEQHHPDKVHIIDINNDWRPDVILQKGSNIDTYLCQSDGSFIKTNAPELDKKARQELAKIQH